MSYSFGRWGGAIVLRNRFHDANALRSVCEETPRCVNAEQSYKLARFSDRSRPGSVLTS